MLEARPAISSQMFVARQPIFDRQQRCVAYELLCRDGGGENRNVLGSGEYATKQTMDVALHLGAMTALTGGHVAYINFTASLLTDGVASILPPDRTVLEILETVEPTPDVVAACRQFKQMGYRFAMDDCVRAGRGGALEPLVDVVKVDFLQTTSAEREAIVRHFAGRSVQMLAEKVETREEFHSAMDFGYTLFQGYFFCKPEVVARKQVPMEKLRYLRFLQLVNEPELDFGAIEATIKQEPGLAMRLLAYLNSAAIGLRQRVTSIGHAITLLGELNLRRWASIFAMTALAEEKPSELVRLSLVRARFIELLAEARQGEVPGSGFDGFLVGLLGTMDAMLDRPMPELLQGLKVSNEVKAAILASNGPLGGLRRVAMAYEQGDWTAMQTHCDRAGLVASGIGSAYRQAVAWADGLASV